ncbi:S9 family peptidase [Muribaculaceae bacterium Isolate-039 (Harlan)]|jgi:dipeptidyl aminopeptidase/acylaminoacyl peptidase|uniref:S9 family peptidase n=3 Tax=Duncaniella muris TaxID=2094150 RepID=UPI000F463869|nr:S9 family peptidase [Duncaniella muris]ROS87805.1 S9 family peptidase [Muribaculaceae bacterium Isolate-039 (Harlan)]ROS99397.1 S9 family peptidase [Muribaculaceae bacterium Isolate-077 (Janvier)]ROS99802.1 S9 family peptidase [Muribaculaceae bacterium Isolate-083 (Janvier)]ROT01955.1 S9 family peptidase [Muribaculaceae bacterium Isolate-084 (Janvier)]
MKNILVMAATALTLTACAGAGEKEADIIDKPDYKSETGVFDIEALEALGRVSAVQVSPATKKVLFNISYESVEQNRSNADLYVMNPDGSDLQRITRTAGSESNFVWINEGRQIAFTYAVEGVPQLFVMNADGSTRKQVTKLEKGVEGFLFSPDEKKVMIISPIKFMREAKDLYEDLPDATGRVIDDLMYKHWDQWMTEIPHPFIGDFDGNEVSNLADIMSDEPMYEAPMRPFGGSESFAWAPDSKSIIYVSRKKTGVDYAVSTNSDLYLYSLEDKTTRNLTEGMMGYDTAPAYSPDGKYVAWLSMEHDGYESDKNRIFLLDTATGEKRDLTANWDYTADAIAWNPDSRSLYFLAARDGVCPIFNMALDGTVSVVAQGECDYAALAPVDEETLITLRHSMLAPNEVCAVKGGEVKQISNVNTELLASLKMPRVERNMVPTTDGKEMLVWAVYPQDFDSTKTYPALLYCQGGPQQAVSQFWSYRWNLALMAANGYIVIAPNRHGLPGFGTEWNAQISGDYPGQNMRDYLAAVDFMKKRPYVDESHIGCTGASYGGFSTYWLAGNHEKRFAAFLAHAGIFNMEAQYLETEEMWFANWDMGDGAKNGPADTATAYDYGAFWKKDNAAAQRTFAMSPHRFVDKWDTPIMVTHGEFDYRILSSQGEMAFNAAKLRGIPAEMLIFPDENHWILKPQNAILWQRLFFRWFDKWLKPESAAKTEAEAK